MGFEKTPVPPPPGVAPSRSNKLPGIFNQRVHNVIAAIDVNDVAAMDVNDVAAMDVDEGGEFEDFVAEMAEIDNDLDPDEGGTLWPGF